MAGENKNPNKSVFNIEDTLDINELASLNDDISLDFIEQLQNQVAQNAANFDNSGATSQQDDSTLFEEVSASSEDAFSAINIPQTDKSKTDNDESAPKAESESAPAPKVNFDASFDDNFIKKYKAKLNKQKNKGLYPNADTNEQDHKEEDISKITSGNIVEKPIVQEQINYNDSLDYLDSNVKYSKYVIYIDPENTDFIESLTVKERKNLINKVLREQEDIALTKKRFNTIQILIKHTIIAIMTIAIAIPIIYYTINTSLEASINNYRRSQTMFKTLYKEKGKIKSTHIR